jgi:LacI family transcriptional regulator, galactose operon repressor
LVLVLPDNVVCNIGELHRAVEDVASARGVAVFAGSVDEDPERERALALALIARRVDGLIVVPAGEDQSYLANEQRAGLSIVFADRPPRLLRADAVVSDNTEGARTAVRHLIAAGHTRIAFLGDLAQIATVGDRFSGYAAALAEAGLDVDEDLVRFDLHGADEAAAAAHEILTAAEPSALFTTQNLITIGVLRALRDLGLQHRVELVGFDDFPLAEMLDPAVTVVAQDPAEVGATECRVLFERMDGDRSPPRLHTIATRLITRGSARSTQSSAARAQRR